jgi:two-component system chemotaxis response regulator CheY
MSIPKPYLLVVEPNTEQQQMLAFRLECFNCQVLVAGTPVELERILSLHTVEIIVTAWSIPGLEGLELLSRLEPRRRSVLLLTENEPEALPATLTLIGLNSNYTRKNRSDLFKRVEDLLTQNQKTVEETPTPTGIQILLVDDSPSIRLFIKKSLEKFIPGVTIREAEDGISAISEMSKKKVDLIVTDLEMPGMDGPTFLRKIRQNPLFRTKPVLVLSGARTNALLDEFKGDSAILFISKPCSPEVLRDSVLRLLKSSSKRL